MIFVFGSNLAGRHGAGAAKDALEQYGAIYGQAEGRQGDSYAIPTKSSKLEPLPLAWINEHVQAFLIYATAHPKLAFQVTRIGCGLAGYRDEDIAPRFRDAPSNCHLNPAWVEIIKS